MTTEHQTTQEEKAYWRLLDEIWEELSEPAHTVIDEARSAAYAENMVHNICFQPEEYEEAMEKMRLAAPELTDRDCELLKAFVRAAIRAYASVDPFDHGTLAGHRVYTSHIHHYYLMVWGMVRDVLRHREHSIRMERLAQEDPVDYSDIPF